jgi:uncharacterized protein (TIGR03437 family)
MRIYLFKLLLVALFAGLSLAAFLQRPARASSSGPPASHTGAPGEQTCATAGCHTGAVNQGSGALTLSGLPEIGYVPGASYFVTVTLAQAARTRFGFQMTVIDDRGRAAGTWDNLEPGRVEMVSARVGANQRQYAGHTQNGVIPNGASQNTWTLRWIAPPQETGRVTFYVIGNAANGNGATSGDSIYTLARSVPVYVASPQTVATVSAASFAPGGLASEAIAALFAQGGLAGGTLISESVPLPTELGGVKVHVKDAAGVERAAPLFFVSPGQINFLVPTGAGNGTATITVLRDDNPVGTGSLNLETVAPGLFAANANGQGVAAAVALRVSSNGVQTIEPVVRFNTATNRAEPLSLDLGPEGDRVFLILFGTGFRLRTALTNVAATIGGANAPVEFAGAQGDLAGLDQANLQIPRSLAGRNATLDLVFRADGKAANTVQIAVK